MIVRTARPDDAEEACTVLRRSISELCFSDHGGEAAILDGWLRNKTPASVRGWIGTQLFLVAEEGGAIAGVASADGGEVALNYVSPDFRFMGVSRALLGNIEERLRADGREQVTLTSTQTAHRFYLSRGYADRGPPQPWRGGRHVFPMAKRLDVPGKA